MHIYEKIGIRRYINAHDTYTVYGGSRMHPDTLAAMTEAAGGFVDMRELQINLGERIAKMTRNEAAYITNGAAGGLLLAAAVTLCGNDMYKFSRLPDTSGLTRDEIIIMRCQRNAYDTAVAASGARIVEVGDADETLDWMIEGAINEHTAAIFYFVNSQFERASMPLEKVIEIAKRRGIFVVVDAAAQLPPKENLWKFTQMGVDIAIFSGGKTLCGPQASGLMLGKRSLIEPCINFGAPTHGICRSSKTSREDMIGLFAALERYLSMDHEQNAQELSKSADRLIDAINSTGSLRGFRVETGPVGQSYPRAFGKLPDSVSGSELAGVMREEGIYIGFDKRQNCIYLSPLNLTGEEIEIVGAALRKCVAKLEAKTT